MTADDWRDGKDTYTFDTPSSSPGYSGASANAFSPVNSDGRLDNTMSRRAHLRVSRVSPWSVTKFSFVVSLVLFVVLFVAVAVLYGILSMLGVFESVSAVISSLTATGGNLFAASRVLGYSAFVGAINVVLVTLLATVGAYIYNLAADLVGGIEVTLSEKDS